MSMFSSLNYLLIKAASTINQTTSTESPGHIYFQETNSSHKLSPFASNENSNINSISQDPSQHSTIGNSTLYFAAEISKSVATPKLENWTNIISLPTSISKEYLEILHQYTNKSDVKLSNKTYPNADHLLESWWNVFDARYLRHGWGLTAFLIMAYMLILVSGVIGNALVILVVALRPRMRSVKNMLIMNLAVADFLVIIFCVPSTLLVNVFAPWILGSYVCKAVAYVQGVSVCVSAYSLAAISFDRCQAVYRNHKHPRGFSRRTCAKTVFVIWVVSIVLNIPLLVTFNVTVSDFDGLCYCVETWKNEKQGSMYFLVVNIGCSYASPLLLIFISNWITYCHVDQREVPSDSAASAPVRQLHRDTRRHVIKMLAIVTLTFLISWFPLYILMIIIKFSDSISESSYNVLGILMPIAQWLGIWNSSINPILHAFLDKKFRKMFKSILRVWIPVNLARKYMLSVRTTTFTIACTETGVPKNKTSNNHDSYEQSSFINSQYKAKPLISSFNQNTGAVTTKSVQNIPDGTSAYLVVSISNSRSSNEQTVSGLETTV